MRRSLYTATSTNTFASIPDHTHVAPAAGTGDANAAAADHAAGVADVAGPRAAGDDEPCDLWLSSTVMLGSRCTLNSLDFRPFDLDPEGSQPARCQDKSR